MRVHLVVCLFLVCAAAAHAQVTKCTDVKGAVTYTNGPCATAEKARTLISQEGVAAMKVDPVEAAATSRRRREVDDRTSAVLRSMAPQPGRQQVGAGSLSGPSSGSPDSHACKKAQHELAVVENIKTFPRDTSPEARAMRRACGLPEVQATQRMVTLASCSDAGCYDLDNTFYARGAGPTFISPSGTVCTAAANALTCPN